MASLAGKVALITGGSKGIGAATALRFAELGAKVAIAYSSDASAADETLKQLNSKTAGLAIKADAATIEGVTYIVNETVKTFGKIDILVPMAGVMFMSPLSATTEENFDTSYALNVKGPYFLAQKAVPHMPQGGRIIFIGTSVNNASTVSPAYLLYCSTKGAIEQMTRVMAKELGTPDKDISVNCVSPGPTGTALFYKGKPDELVKTIASWNPHNKIGEPEDVADCVAMVAGTQSRWMTGQNVRVNGGMC